jgi:Tfp pilus assembly protein FimV
MRAFPLSPELVRLLGAALLVVSVAVGQAFAASPAPAAAASADVSAPAAGRTYTTVAGDTLDRVIHKTLGQSPLKPELLRQAMVQANPQGMPAGRNPRFKPGTVLQLPDHDAMLRAIVLPVLQPAEAGALSGATASAEARKRWIRYP